MGRKFESQCVMVAIIMLCLGLTGIAIFTVKEVEYDCIIHETSKSEAIHLLKNYVLDYRRYIKNTCQIKRC